MKSNLYMSTWPLARGSRLVVVWMALMGLTSCRTSPPPSAPQEPAAVPAAGAVPAGAHEYQVLADQSLLQILVYRGGAAARLGHNHVIASHHLAGVVHVTGDPLATRFDISFP